MRAASRERRYVTPAILIVRSDMNGRHGCRICSQFVGFIVASRWMSTVGCAQAEKESSSREAGALSVMIDHEDSRVAVCEATGRQQVSRCSYGSAHDPFQEFLGRLSEGHAREPFALSLTLVRRLVDIVGWMI